MLKVAIVFAVFIAFWIFHRFIIIGGSITEWFLENYIGDFNVPEFISETSMNLIIDRALFFTVLTFLFRTVDDKTTTILSKILSVAISFALFLIMFTILSLSIFDKFDLIYPF